MPDGTINYEGQEILFELAWNKPADYDLETGIADPTTETFTDVLFSHGVNCEIYGEELFFTGKYRDIYSISSITELGISLSAATSYTGVGGYYLDLKLGKLVRIGQVWSCQQLAIKASGSLGIGGSGGAEDLKEAIIEMVAAKSGLWKNNIQTENGTIQNTRVNISDYAKAVLASYGFTWRKDL